MKLSKTLVLPLAGLLAIGAAGAVMATTGIGMPTADQGGTGTVPAVDQPTPAPPAPAAKPRTGPVAQVLDELVNKGTITAAQEGAILDALDARRGDRKAVRTQVRGFLADGEITQAELDQLPAGHPLRRLTSLMDDGKITIDELKSLGRGAPKGLGIGKGGPAGALNPGESAPPSNGG